MFTYIKNRDIYFREFENSDERFLSNLTEQVHKEAFLAIEIRKNNFSNEPLNPLYADWLDNWTINIVIDDENSPEYWALKDGTVKELFDRVVLDKLGFSI